MAVEFQAWGKIPRLYRHCIISEKIDGTNSAVRIVPLSEIDHIRGAAEDGGPLLFDNDQRNLIARVEMDDYYYVFAQSRNRLITTEYDNFNFAQWVWIWANELVEVLGPGIHFGEFWGSGIGRGYGLQNGERRFSLFNTPRYTDKSKFDLTKVQGLSTVPVLYEGNFRTEDVDDAIQRLREEGSLAAPGFDRPEGVVTFHVAANIAFKTTLEKDEKPKGSNERG